MLDIFAANGIQDATFDLLSDPLHQRRIKPVADHLQHTGEMRSILLR